MMSLNLVIIRQHQNKKTTVTLESLSAGYATSSCNENSDCEIAEHVALGKPLNFQAQIH